MSVPVFLPLIPLRELENKVVDDMDWRDEFSSFNINSFGYSALQIENIAPYVYIKDGSQISCKGVKYDFDGDYELLNSAPRVDGTPSVFGLDKLVENDDGSIMVGIFSTNSYRSIDGGETWVSYSSFSKSVNSIVYGNGLFIAVGDKEYITTSPDGITWTTRKSSANFWNIMDIDYSGTEFMACFRDTSASGPRGGYYTSSDGITWSSATFLSGSGAVQSIAFGYYYWVIVDGNPGGGHIYSSLASSISFTLKYTASDSLYSVDYSPDDHIFITCGTGGVVIKGDSTGTTWTDISQWNTDWNFWRVHYTSDGWILSGEEFVTPITAYNFKTIDEGTNWYQITTGFTEGNADDKYIRWILEHDGEIWLGGYGTCDQISKSTEVLWRYYTWTFDGELEVKDKEKYISSEYEYDDVFQGWYLSDTNKRIIAYYDNGNVYTIDSEEGVQE